MKERELDSVLQVIENPVRRRIIKRLSQESCYALQLSKELGLGQALVAKHMSVMEKAGVVTSAVEASPSGPERRRYSLAKSISITMDLAPHLFNERAISFNMPSTKPNTAREADGAFGDRVREALAAADEGGKLSLISKVLGDVDTRIALVEEERVGLLSVKNELMDEAAKIVANLGDLDSRRVVFHILEEHDREVESISQSLDMREMLVRSILEALDRQFF
ncbi:MAG TPA: ArsR family transcriptional regulator [Nitrososphaerales archaeon]|nr:ArsR family transcriptional regulator [Nitrososphaerales archaeon]